jgi:hypothetical protein
MRVDQLHGRDLLRADTFGHFGEREIDNVVQFDLDLLL